VATQYVCKDWERRRKVDQSYEINGIDYLEMAPDQKTLEVYLFPKGEGAAAPDASVLTKDNVLIEGGSRVRDVRVDHVRASANVLTVALNKRGDFSAYRLRLVSSATDSGPPTGFDRQLSEIEFFFQRDYLSEFDCAGAQVCPETTWPVPQIDYLAKDYASFRRLMLDRLAVIMPDWRERNPADVGIVLVELLAYAADHLSYYQDAVATEAYLGTARKRVSVRRHARLLDYPMHDGCNARAWVTMLFEPEYPRDDGVILPGPSEDGPGTMLLTRTDTLPAALSPQPAPVLGGGTEVFETLHDLSLRAAHNEIHFYTWGDKECCLLKGATRASVKQKNAGGLVDLVKGQVLIFEEIRGPKSGQEADADPTHRHAVRLTGVMSTTDPLYKEDGDADQDLRVLDLEWAPEDALPFALCLSTIVGDEPLENISVARGNAVLADHGRTIIPRRELDESAETLGEIPRRGRHYQTKLKFGPLTQQGHARGRLGRLVFDPEDRPLRFDPDGPASAALHSEMRDVLPAVELRDGQGVTWRPQRDLLSSDRPRIRGRDRRRRQLLPALRGRRDGQNADKRSESHLPCR
jgi:hypothetical protein